VHGLAVAVQKLVVVKGLELGALVQRQRHDSSDAEKYPRGLGHAVDSLQLQSLHPVPPVKYTCSLLLIQLSAEEHGESPLFWFEFLT
jgi:hypothetical protein